MEKQHYLACLDLAGRACLVVGEGAMALEKVDGLAAAGAIVTRVAPDSYRASDLDDRWLVVAATSDDELNHRVSEDARARRIFCNVADVPELCSFILPAIHRRGPIGFEHEQLAAELQRIRPWVKQNLHTYEERRDYFRERVAEALS